VLAHTLRNVVSEARKPRLSQTSSVVNFAAVRLCERQLGTLARRLADLEQLISPASILLVHDLLRGFESPLYDRDRTHELARTVDTILTRLDQVD
jgi:hypothetical protein